MDSDSTHIDHNSRITYDIPPNRKKPIQTVQCPDIYLPNIQKDSIRIVHISDTHCNHNQYLNDIPYGDILVHSGDFFDELTLNASGQIVETRFIKDFITFFNALPHTFKIYVAGNHSCDLWKLKYDDICTLLCIDNKNVIYLQDNAVNIYGINFYGSPFNDIDKYQGTLHKAFCVDEQRLAQKWNDIPLNTDILITHQPPFAIMDLAKGKSFDSRVKEMKDNKYLRDALYMYEQWGCKYLRNKIENDIKPSAHLFGHAHRSTGYVLKNDILFVNSALNANKIIHYFDVKKIIKQCKL
eukprot:270148_1